MKRSLFNCVHPFRQRWSIGCLAVALSCASLADEAPPAAAGAETQRLVDINEYVVRGNTVLDNRAIEAAVYPFLGPQRSLGDIEGARDALQAAYQEKGYQSVYVELPEQQVSGGVVYLQVTETTVGRVRVVGAKHYSPVELREEVPALEEGKVPDFAQVQRELAQVNRTPGRQVLPMVREGQRPGTMDVDLQVEDKNPWHASIGLNNDYSADTRHLRSVVSLGYDNLWQLGHAISLTYFTAPQDQDNAKVWSGSYTAPLRRLVETVRDNSELGVKAVPAKSGTETVADKTASLVDKSVKTSDDAQTAPPIMDIARAFAPMSQLLDAKGERASYLDETMQAIGSVQDRVRIVHDSPDRGKAALGLVLERFSLKGPDPIANLQRIAAGLPEPMNRQVGKLADESSRVILVEALRELERRWNADVYRFYRERLANRYPFNPASREEASLEDFTAFFGPQGRLQQFRNKYLNLFLEENLEALYSERLGGYLVRADVLTQLESADRIRDAFFNSRGLLGVQFYVEPLGLAPNKRSSSLSVEGQLVTYNHGPTTSTALIWPNTLAPSNESRMTLVNAGGSSSGLVYRGPWSLYRLLSQARLNGATSTSVDISFSAPDGGMRYRISTEKANNPFTQPLFKGFVLPHTLLQDGLRARADSDGNAGRRLREAG